MQKPRSQSQVLKALMSDSSQPKEHVKSKLVILKTEEGTIWEKSRNCKKRGQCHRLTLYLHFGMEDITCTLVL